MIPDWQTLDEAADVIRAAYKREGRQRRTGRECLELARMLRRATVDFDLTQDKIARLTGMTAGTVHHYTSLLDVDPELRHALDSGRLTFKETRALADLSPHARQREIGAIFITGRLSSVDCERVVRIARTYPHLGSDGVLARAMNGEMAGVVEHKPGPAPDPAPKAPDFLAANEAVSAAAKVCATVTSGSVPEIARLPLRRSLPILIREAQRALSKIGD